MSLTVIEKNARQSIRSQILKEMAKSDWSPMVVNYLSGKAPEVKYAEPPDLYKNEIIVSKVCELFSIPREIVISKSRKREAVLSRNMIAYYLLKIECLPDQQVCNTIQRDRTLLYRLIESFEQDYKVNYYNSKDYFLELLKSMNKKINEELV